MENRAKSNKTKKKKKQQQQQKTIELEFTTLYTDMYMLHTFSVCTCSNCIEVGDTKIIFHSIGVLWLYDTAYGGKKGKKH